MTDSINHFTIVNILKLADVLCGYSLKKPLITVSLTDALNDVGMLMMAKGFEKVFVKVI